MLYLIGCGLRFSDIPFRAVSIAKSCDERILEAYTSISTDLKELRELIGDFKIASRTEIENEMDLILEKARNKDIAILVMGDPLAATTHFSFVYEAKRKNIRVEVIHASSIFTAITNTGLMLYKFGKTISIPFRDKVDLPISVYEGIEKNFSANLHTLLLLDLDPFNNQFMDPFMAVNDLLRLEEHLNKGVINRDREIIICSRLGLDNEKIIYTTINEFLSLSPSIGKPPYCLILPSSLSRIEKEFLSIYKLK